MHVVLASYNLSTAAVGAEWRVNKLSCISYCTEKDDTFKSPLGHTADGLRQLWGIYAECDPYLYLCVKMTCRGKKKGSYVKLKN